ncbi:MAG: DUF5989 family protein [Myxococcota bacterium]
MSQPPASYTPGRVESFLLRLGTVGELFALLVRGGRWWMLPLVCVLMAVAALLLFLQGFQYVAPFIYMIF